MIVRGSHSGEKAKVVKTDKKTEKVVVETQSELEVLMLDEDDVS